MTKSLLHDLSRGSRRLLPRRARPIHLRPTGALPMRKWRVCSEPRPSAWPWTRPAAGSPTGSMNPLHDVVEPMTHHVIMAYNGAVQRMERRSGRFVSTGTFRPGVVIVIPEGSSSRWDIPKPVDVVQLYLPHRTLARVADEADTATPIDLLERTAHPDPITSRLLLSAADVLEGNEALDSLFSSN